MCFRPTCIIGSMRLAGLVLGHVFACSGICLGMVGKREIENRQGLGLGMWHQSVSAHFLCHSSCSLCTSSHLCRILHAKGFLSIGGSVLFLLLLNTKFRLFGLYMKM